MVCNQNHVGIHRNEEADTATKEGLQLPSSVNSTTYIERKEMIGKIKQYVVGKWQTEYTERSLLQEDRVARVNQNHVDLYDT